MSGSFRSIVLAGSVALAAASCATHPVDVKTAPAPGNAAPCPGGGEARVGGRAFARQRNGDLVPGSGRPVYLDPATRYSTAVFRAITDQQNKTSFFKAEKESATVVPDPAMLKCRRTVQADTDGAFTFDRVAPGPYFVSSYISWLTPAGTWLGMWNVSSVTVGADGKIEVVLSGVPASVPDMPAH